jgi:pantothenate kinase type III
MKALAENIRQSLRTEISNMLKTELSQLVKMISKDLTAAVIASVRSELATTVRAVVQEITPSSPTPASPFHKRSKPDSDLDLDDVTTNLDTQLSYQPIQSQPPEDTSMSILR